jgi:hypothetical protein
MHFTENSKLNSDISEHSVCSIFKAGRCRMTKFENSWGIHTGRRFGSKTAWADWKEGDGVGVGPVTKQVASFLLAQAIFEPNLFPVWIPQLFSNLVILHLPAYKDGTECSETSAYKIQTPGNYPEENIQHSEHGESLKSRNCYLFFNVLNYIYIYYSNF